MRHEQNDISMSLVQLDYSYCLKFDVNINVILLSTFNDVGTAIQSGFFKHYKSSNHKCQWKKFDFILVICHFRLNLSPWYYIIADLHTYITSWNCAMKVRASLFALHRWRNQKQEFCWRDIYISRGTRGSPRTLLRSARIIRVCVCGPLAPSKFKWKFAKFVLYQSALFLRNRFIRTWLCRSAQIAITRVRFTRRETKFPVCYIYIYIIRWFARPSIEPTRGAELKEWFIEIWDKLRSCQWELFDPDALFKIEKSSMNKWRAGEEAEVASGTDEREEESLGYGK